MDSCVTDSLMSEDNDYDTSLDLVSLSSGASPSFTTTNHSSQPETAPVLTSPSLAQTANSKISNSLTIFTVAPTNTTPSNNSASSSSNNKTSEISETPNNKNALENNQEQQDMNLK